MTLIAEKTAHLPSISWHDIPGYFDFDRLYQEMINKAQDGSRFVEIGTLFGRSTAFMAHNITLSRKKIAFDSLDHYPLLIDDSLKEFDKADLKSTLHSTNLLRTIISKLPTMFDMTSTLIAMTGVRNAVNLIKTTGQKHVSAYEDNSLNFVFIDAEHTFEDTLEMLSLYYPKVSHGGVIAGHDHAEWCPGVIRATNEFFGKNNYQIDKYSFIKQKP